MLRLSSGVVVYLNFCFGCEKGLVCAVKKFFEVLLGFSGCFLGAFFGLVDVLGSAPRLLRGLSMLSKVTFYVGKRGFWMMFQPVEQQAESGCFRWF